MEKANVNDIEIEYEVTGSGEPVLLIGHIVADALVPLTTEPALAERYLLVRYHKRGWAGSTHTEPPVTIAEHAADAAALLDHLGLRPAHVVGHSSGGCVALQLAADHPGAVHTLVLLEPTLLSLPSAQGVLAHAGPALEAYADGRADEAVSIFMSAVTGLDRSVCQRVIEEHVPDAFSHAIDDVDTLFGVELPAVLAWSLGTEQTAALDMPVLSVVGANTDRLWLDIAALLRLCVRDVEEVTIDGVGHFLQLEEPEPVASAIADFLGRHPMMVAAASAGASTA